MTQVGRYCISLTPHIVYRDTIETVRISLLQYCEAVLVIHITRLGKFTAMPAEVMELYQPIQIKPGQSANGNWHRNSWLFLSHADKEQGRKTFPPPLHTSWPIGVGEEGAARGWGSRVVTWRRRGGREFYSDAHRRPLWTSCVVPDA